MGTEELKAKLRLMIKECSETTEQVYLRWLDERKYEDINDYQRFFHPIEDHGGHIYQMTKRPFGCKFELCDMQFLMGVISDEVYVRQL